MKDMLHTRNDAAGVLLDMIRPLKKYYSPGKAWLHVGNTAAHYGAKNADMEGFARVLWGLGPLWAGCKFGFDEAIEQEAEEWRSLYRDGIVHGTDPKHQEYWGDVTDYDQKMVEMAAIAVTFSICPDSMWNLFSEEERKRVFLWLDQINQREVHKNNWRFFRILVNMAFCLLNLPWNQKKMMEDFEVIESCSIENGWYFDGNPGQMDYYIPFAMHFYGLVFAQLMQEKYPEYTRILKDRGQIFAGDFIYWFGKDGKEIPFGRSLTYRFAHSAFFSAMAFAGMEGPGYGIMKHLVLGNLRCWLERPIFDHDGVLTIGYGYPSLFMSERYNAPGSPYWSFKTFLFLALPEDHEFWQAEEQEAVFEPLRKIALARMLISHGANDHVQMFPAAHHAANHGSCREKYEKFVYSNQFGFAVGRGTSLEDGGFDCTLAVSEAGEECYRMRYGVERWEITERTVMTAYSIGKNVFVRTTLIPAGAWHVRIHEIENRVPIDVADGGFSIGAERPFTIEAGAGNGKYTEDMVKQDRTCISIQTNWGTTGICLETAGNTRMVFSSPNLHLFFPLSLYPAVVDRLEPGQHCLITSVAADQSASWGQLLEEKPIVIKEKRDVTVIQKNGENVCVTLEDGVRNRIHV